MKSVMRVNRKFIFTTIVLFLLNYTIYGQVCTQEEPVSFKTNIRVLQKNEHTYKLLPSLDMGKIEQEDKEDEENGIPPRFGYRHEVNYNLENSGEWTVLSNGDKIWRLSISCPGALSINLLYDKFWLPAGAKFFVYSNDRKHSIGAITFEYDKTDVEKIQGFATGLVYGDQITLEYYLPKGIKEIGIISVAYVVHGYKYILLTNNVKANYGDSDYCNININCPDGQNWQNEKNAVAMILINGYRCCTGSLINTTANDNSPLFLTADHCLKSGVNGSEWYDAMGNSLLRHWSFYWNYESPECANMLPPTLYTVGAKILANNSDSDFALLQLSQDPRYLNGYTPYYLGWDRSENMEAGGVGIHHPNGDIKKISTYTVIPRSAKFLDDIGIETHWGIVWDRGITAGTSSGSALINNSHRIIGQLHGGHSSCTNLTGEDFYGKFSLSWTGNGATDKRRRLNDWLDPKKTNVNTLDGMSVCSEGIVDLMIKDTPEDMGIEPNLVSEYLYVSPDIWVRNQNDGVTNQIHENPNYVPDQPVYVYVRVRNIGCISSRGNEKLYLHWSKAGPYWDWPGPWTGELDMPSVPLGNLVDLQYINSITAGRETIAVFKWYPPSPANYESITDEPWHFCLLARIESDQDPIRENESLGEFIKTNNNVAMKNVHVIDNAINSGLTGGVIGFMNTFDKDKTFRLHFKIPKEDMEHPVNKESEIIIKLSPSLFKAWESCGSQGVGIKNKGDFQIEVVEPFAYIDFNLTPGGFHTIYTGFHFLTQQVTDKSSFKYVIELQSLKEKEEYNTLGGELYIINKWDRKLFKADAGNNKLVSKNEKIQLQANTIAEPAIYNWYDMNGSLLYTGSNFSTFINETQTYKLEVIAEKDGYKDYDEVTVKVKEFEIIKLFPNPAQTNITVEYDATGAVSALMSIFNINGILIRNIPLDIQSNNVNLDISNYQQGAYSIVFNCNGQMKDIKMFIKNE